MKKQYNEPETVVIKIANEVIATSDTGEPGELPEI